MFSNSIKEYTRFVLEQVGHRFFTDEEIDQIMFSWGWKCNAHVKEVE